MLKFISKNIIKIISTVAVVILAVFFSAWIMTDAGKSVFKSFVENLPFVNLFYSTYTKITGYSENMLEITFASTLYDFTKLLITTFIKGVLFLVAYKIISLITGLDKIFNMASSYTGGVRSFLIDKMEDKMASPLYKILEAVAKTIVGVISTIIVNAVCTPIKDYMDNTDGIAAGVFILIVFITVYIIYSLIFSWHNSKTVEYGLIKTYLVNIIPEILTVFMTNVIYFAMYAALVRGAEAYFIGLIIVLLLWSLAETYIKKFFSYMAAMLGLRNDSSILKRPGMSIIQIVLWVVHIILSMLLFYAMVLLFEGTAGQGGNITTFVPFYAVLVGKTTFGSTFLLDTYFHIELLKLVVTCMVFSALNKRPPIKSCILWLLVWFGVSAAVTLAADIGINFLLAANRYEIWFGIILIVTVSVIFFDTSLVITTACVTVVLACVIYWLCSMGIVIDTSALVSLPPFLCGIGAVEICAAIAYKLRRK